MTTNKKAAPAEAAQNTATSNTCDHITVLKSLGARLTKKYLADGTVLPYEDAASFFVKRVEVSSLKDMVGLLAKLHQTPTRSLIRGKLTGNEPGSKSGTYVRTNANFSDQPLHWFMVDIDGFRPDWADPVTHPELAIDEFFEAVLPDCFKTASYYWHLSSSAGMPGKEGILKCHLHLWSKTAYTTAQMSAWAKVIGTGIDSAVYRRVQHHYVADPVFEEGRTDPVKVRAGWHQGETDEVDLVIGQSIIEQAREQGAGVGGEDMKLVDPSEKDGLIGLFHRTYSAEDVLLTHLDEFEQISERRYTWHNGGGTPEGVWVHNDGNHVGSSHNTWPIDGIANLWDLVREFKFGDLDVPEGADDFEKLNAETLPVGQRPSDQAMYEWAGELPEMIETEKLEEAQRRAEEEAELAVLVAKISSSGSSELNGPLTEKIRAMKAEGIDAGTAATLDKAMQSRLKALSPNQAAPSIADVRRQTKPETPKQVGKQRVLDGDDQLGIARELTKTEFLDQNRQRLAVRTGGAWYRFDDRCFVELDEEQLRNTTWKYLGTALKRTEEGVAAFKPSRSDVSGVVDALRAVLAADVPHPPAWMPGHEGTDPLNLVVVNNGVLDVATGELDEHTPKLFATNCLPFDFDPVAQCPLWLRFLDDVWGTDEESKETLQELFGYSLTADTRQQKIFMLIGIKRSGKGTIARILGELVGHANRASPTMASLASPTGLECLIGKLLAIVGDARGGGREPQVTVERLLSISGEDAISFDRKYKSYWTGKLPTRFVIMSNELLRLGDASGALAGRLIILQTTRSFFGHEDTSLTDRLLTELPGILNWALVGKRRLAERGRFVQPTSAKHLVEETADANNPVGRFFAEFCEAGADFRERVSVVFDAWLMWCRRENHQKPGSKSLFSQNLKASVSDVGTAKPRGVDGKQHDCYTGMRLRPDVLESLGLFNFEKT